VTKISVGAVLFALALSACSRGANDERITARVNQRLASEPQPLSVRIETDNRIVTLKGVVMSPSEHERIVGAVRSVEGVVAVDDQLVVQAPVTTTGSELDHDREPVGP
jgi:osmotically-inducible protein OsmY